MDSIQTLILSILLLYFVKIKKKKKKHFHLLYPMFRSVWVIMQIS